MTETCPTAPSTRNVWAVKCSDPITRILSLRQAKQTVSPLGTQLMRGVHHMAGSPFLTGIAQKSIGQNSHIDKLVSISTGNKVPLIYGVACFMPPNCQ